MGLPNIFILLKIPKRIIIIALMDNFIICGFFKDKNSFKTVFGFDGIGFGMFA